MVDNKDLLILGALKKNAKASVARIAKDTGLPATTVHNRIKKMQNDKIIKNYTIKIDHKKIGNDLSAYILVTVNYNYFKKKSVGLTPLVEKIAKIPKVEEVSVVTGETDLIVKGRAKNMEELDRLLMDEIRTYGGVEKTVTLVIVQEVSN